MVAELKLAATVQDFEAMNSEVDELSDELEQRYVATFVQGRKARILSCHVFLPAFLGCARLRASSRSSTQS